MHSTHRRQVASSAFTLIELLVVIAIIAILAVVVVLTLNPAQLLAQSRDANRVSDMATLNTALGLYQTDSGGTGFMGTSTVVYISLVDTSSTCGNLNLPALPVGSMYQCASSTSTRLTNTSGWIPVNFQNISSGAPFGSLPIDPVNTSSTGLYYTYNTSSSQFMVSALPESQKQKQSLGAKPMIPNYPDVIANGSSLTINPLFNQTGLVGYWPMDEGAGSSTQDMSGNGNAGTWSGTAGGTNSTYYTTGKVGNWAGTFDGSTTYANITSTASLQVIGNITLTAWIKQSASSRNTIVSKGYTNEFDFLADSNCGVGGLSFYQGNGTSFAPVCSTSGLVPVNTWMFVAVTRVIVSGTSTIVFYVNGNSVSGGTIGSIYQPAIGSLGVNIGRRSEVMNYFLGLIDDVRIYNRALSAAEISALYNAGK
jgi:prepilin-type N-terminal cleavage/methylation domain-containing protein